MISRLGMYALDAVYAIANRPQATLPSLASPSAVALHNPPAVQGTVVRDALRLPRLGRGSRRQILRVSANDRAAWDVKPATARPTL